MTYQSQAQKRVRPRTGRRAEDTQYRQILPFYASPTGSNQSSPIGPKPIHRY